jgi:large subunit ribosomal protein L21
VRPPALAHLRSIHSPVVPSSTAAALDFIRSQPSQYVVASIVGRKYILTPSDTLSIPRLRDVNVGDVLLLDEINELGSRDFTLRGNPSIPASRVQVHATVLEHTKGPMEFIYKKKRRKGYQKRKTHKQTYTRLRIGDIHILPHQSASSTILPPPPPVPPLNEVDTYRSS